MPQESYLLWSSTLPTAASAVVTDDTTRVLRASYKCTKAQTHTTAEGTQRSWQMRVHQLRLPEATQIH
jgi:hypothetical protein